jgi:hypothetical protein
MHALFFIFFFFKFANPLTFPVVRRLYGTDRFEKKNRFRTEPVTGGLKAPPSNNKCHSHPPVIWLSYMTNCLMWRMRDVPNSTPHKDAQLASLILEGPFASSSRNPG